MTNFDAQDRGFLLGDGVFDTCLVFNGKPLQLQRHRQRLLKHAHSIGIVFQQEDLEKAQERHIKTIKGHAIVRTTLTRGKAKRGLWPVEEATEPTLSVLVSSFDPKSLGQRVQATWATIRRNETSPLTQIKSLSYLEPILALREAHEKGYEEAVFLNTKGRVTCATTANIFIQEGSKLVTPPLEEGVLDGVTRDQMLVHPPQGFSAQEGIISAQRLMEADAVVLSNSTRLIRSLSRIDNVEKTEPDWIADWNNKYLMNP